MEKEIAEQQLLAIFDSIDEPVYVADPENYEVLYTNLCLRKKLGDVLGKKCYAVFHGKTKPCSFCTNKYLFGKKQNQSYIWEFLNEMDKRWYRCIDKAITWPDGRKVRCEIAFDITERKNKEKQLLRDKRGLKEEINKKDNELNETQKALQCARRLSDIGILSATVAHELRNPLGVIKLAVYNVQRKNRNPALQKHLDNIDRKIEESNQIIRNLLSYSHLQVPQFTLFPLCEKLQDCYTQMKKKYRGWNVDFLFTCTSSCTVLIEADPVHITELVTNLIDNAFQALPEKEGKIKLSCTIDTSENKCCIAIIDNGVGIDSQEMTKIFEPFYTSKTRGIGLGLPVCKQIVQMHGGVLEMTSNPDSGANVTITLPLQRM